MKTATLTAPSLRWPCSARPRAQTPAGTAGSAAAGRHVGTSSRRRRRHSADYRLAAGDKLRIEVYKDAQLSQSLQVRPDGKITLPLVGDVAAAGRTPIELRDAISAALKEYITNPVVTVIVVETRPPQVVYVTGEVNKPGALTLTAAR